MRSQLDRLKHLLAPAAAEGGHEGWIFAEEIASAVTRDECARLAELARGAAVLEVGSYYGRSTIALASTAAVVHSVDPHTGGQDGAPNTLPAFLDNLERHGVRDKVIVHVGLSTQIVPLLKEETFDLVFIDAMHQRPEVDIDFALAAPSLRGGGRFAFHDYGVDGVQVGELWHPFGVTEAVDELAGKPGVTGPEIVDALAILALEAPATTWQALCASLPDPYSITPTPQPSRVDPNTSST